MRTVLTKKVGLWTEAEENVVIMGCQVIGFGGAPMAEPNQMILQGHLNRKDIEVALGHSDFTMMIE